MCHRRDTENAIRGFLCALGRRFPRGSGKLAARVRDALDARPDLKPMIEPLLASVEAPQTQIKRLDGDVVLAAKVSPASRLPMTVRGVGPVTAMAYAATIGDATRFAGSRDVGAYGGLASRRYQSGEMDDSGRLSKYGDALLRSPLDEAANSLLTIVRGSHPLKDWPRRIRNRGSHKKARVALARKLAVIMHRMPITGAASRWPQKEEPA